VERFIETPDMKRRHQEDMGFCWFCGCKSGCQSCERWVDPDVERNLGKNKFWEEDEGGDLEMVEQPRKRARTTKTKGKGKEKVPATPRQARAKTRLQRKAGQASKGARTEATPKHVHQEYFAVPHYNQTTAGNSQPLLWHENPASYQTYQQSHSPYLSTQSEAGPSNYQANNYAQHQIYRRVPGDLYDSQAHVTPAAETPQTLFFGGYTNYQDTNHQQTEPDWTSLVDPALLYEYKAPKLPATPGRELYQSYSLANINDELGRTSRVDQAEDSFGVNCSYAVNIQALKEQSKEVSRKSRQKYLCLHNHRLGRLLKRSSKRTKGVRLVGLSDQRVYLLHQRLSEQQSASLELWTHES